MGGRTEEDRALSSGDCKPALCTRRRREIVEMALPPGNRRDSDLRRTLFSTSQGTRHEDARKDGQIRGRSRWLVHNAG
jgi:hypothetical protein